MRKPLAEPRHAIFDAFSAIATAYCAAFSWVFFAVVEDAVLGQVHLVGGLLVAGNWVMTRITRQRELGTTVILMTGAAIVTSLFATGGWEGTGYLWTFAYLPYPGLLTSRRGAAAWMAALFGAEMLTVAADALGLVDVPYSGAQILNFSASFLIFAGCVYIYQASLEKYRKLAEERLVLVRHYTRRLETLIDQMPVGIMIVEGRKGFPTMTNEAVFRLLGREIDAHKAGAEFSAAYGLEREDGAPYPADELPINLSLATGRQSMRSDIFIRQADGSRIAVRMACVPIREESGEAAAAAIVVLEDMTAEYEADRQKSEFISIASHELRAPLTGIKWNADLLLEGDEGRLTPGQRAYVTHIREINDRLTELVNELLNVSRLEVGTVKLRPERLDLSALIDAVVKELSGPIEAKRQKLLLDRTHLPEIAADPRIVRQVLVNLISNASKYTPEGGTVTVTVGAEGDRVRVAVRDTGIGIPKAQQSQMFKKFFRAENAARGEIEGTGLGLYITKKAVEMSGGTIGFESLENQGSTFWFTLPIGGPPAA
jgi:signal transduction histidine kinase